MASENIPHDVRTPRESDDAWPQITDPDGVLERETTFGDRAVDEQDGDTDH